MTVIEHDRAIPDQWDRRLATLGSSSDPEFPPPVPQVETRVRRILARLDALGADPARYKLFRGEDGAIEIQRRDGGRYRTIEVTSDRIIFHVVDLDADTCTSRPYGRKPTP